MPYFNYREASKLAWGDSKYNGDQLDREEITLGAILRIADATEAMSKSHKQLEIEKEFYRRKHHDNKKTIEHLHKSIAAHKGVATKLRNDIEQEKARAFSLQQQLSVAEKHIGAAELWKMIEDAGIVKKDSD